MRKLLLVICSLLFIGCSYNYEGIEYTESDFIHLRYIASNIAVDVHTDVLYWHSSAYNITPILKADGTCLTLTEWQERKRRSTHE